jgi:N-acetyl-gamma-glutamyl-phosphate reductase
VTLACAPLAALGLVDPCFRVSAVTGATGAGRTPKESTHLPERGSNMFAYGPLDHRHRPEMEGLVERASGRPAEVLFVPHSGPWSRGIHATVHAELVRPLARDELVDQLQRFYQHTPFVAVSPEPPRMKDVVATNRCHLGVAVEGRHAVIMSVIDNLTKGAAGGAVQWMNRLLGFEAAEGLLLPGPGWS